jgi:antitoxin CcdA
MTLAEWFALSEMSQATFAKRCGVHPVTVAKWKAGGHTPRPAQMAAILATTRGRVTANDFCRAPGFAEAQAPLGDMVRLDAAAIAEAHALGVDVEAVCEKAVAEAISDEKGRRWVEENRPAMDAWNAWTDANELPLAKYRAF